MPWGWADLARLAPAFAPALFGCGELQKLDLAMPNSESMLLAFDAGEQGIDVLARDAADAFRVNSGTARRVEVWGFDVSLAELEDQLWDFAVGYEAGRRGGSAPAVLNAADEVAVAAFVQGQIGFTSIPVVVERALATVPWREVTTVEDVVAVDAEARDAAFDAVGRSC